MPWNNTQPSWLRDMNPWHAFAEANQAMNEAVIAPLRYQQAQNTLKKQVLDIAHAGIENQLESKRLDFEMQTMPDKVAQVQTQTKMQEIQLDQANKSRQWQTEDATTLHDWKSNWLNSSWEDRLNMQVPDLHDAKATQDAVTWRKAQLDTWDAKQKQDDQTYFLQRIDALTPDQRAMVKTIKDPIDQIVALQRFEQENIALAEQKKAKVAADLQSGKIAIETERTKRALEVQGKRNEGALATAAQKAKDQITIKKLGLTKAVSEDEFINRHFNAMVKEMAGTPPANVIKELKRLYEENFTSPTTSTDSAVPTVSSKDDYDALPSGTEFIGSDGQRYRKP